MIGERHVSEQERKALPAGGAVIRWRPTSSTLLRAY